MSKDKVINNLQELNNIMTSTEGYPIFDIMHTAHPKDYAGNTLSGYISSAGYVFYSENEDEINKIYELKEEDNKDKIINHLLMNKKNVHSFSELRDLGIKEMNQSQSLAYSHLKSKERILQNMGSKYYGYEHIIEKNKDGEYKVLIFKNSSASHGYKDKKDLKNPENYYKFIADLKIEYQNQKITPETIIEGNAAKKIHEGIISVFGEFINSYQQEVTNILQEFKYEFDQNMKYSFKNGDNYYLNIEYNNYHINIRIPESKDKPFVIKYDDKYQESVSNIYNVILNIHQTLSHSKISKFLSKTLNI